MDPQSEVDNRVLALPINQKEPSVKELIERIAEEVGKIIEELPKKVIV